MRLSMLSSHIERIYSSVGSANGWHELLVSMVADLKFRSGLLSLETFGGGKIHKRHYHNYSNKEKQLIISHYHKLDPWTQRLGELPKGWFYASDEAVPDIEFKSTEFYNDFCKEFDLRYSSGMYIDIGFDLGFKIAFQSAHGMASHREKIPYLNHLAAHFRKAIELQNRLEHSNSSFSGNTELNELKLPAILVDQHGGVIGYSEKAQALFSAGKMLRRVNGQLRVHHRLQTQLDETLRQCHKFVNGEQVAPPRKRFILPSIGGRHYALNIDPVRILDSMFGGNAGRYLSLLTVERVGTETFRWNEDKKLDLDLSRAVAQYGLTAKEVALVQGLISGKTLTALCGEQSRSINTLRSHLKSVFAKTGTHSQAQLVARLLQSS